MPLYFFEDTRTGKKRNTGVSAPNVKAAKAKLKRPPAEHAKVYKVLNKKPSSSAWDRTRADGKSPEKSKYGKGRGFGPPR